MIKRRIRYSTYVSLWIWNIMCSFLKAAGHNDPFSKFEQALKTTEKGMGKIVYLILGVMFLYAVVAGIWFHRWAQAVMVIIGGMLIALWPTILAFIKSIA